MSSACGLIRQLVGVGMSHWGGGFVLAVLCVFCSLELAQASVPNNLQRIDVRQKGRYTRITLKLSAEPNYSVVRLPGNRLRVHLLDTSGALFKRLRHYSDSNIGGLLFSQRGKDMVLTFAIASKGVGWRAVHIDGLPAVSLDVGPLFAGASKPAILPGRERIWAGAEKLLRDYDPPIKPEVPFVPTDRQVLHTLLDDNDQKSFLAAEGALYKGKLTAAEEVFAQFAARKGAAIRPLALYRLAETQYRLQKYSQALATFREAEPLWADFLSFNPGTMFYYGDSIARSGDLPGGRQLLSRLIVAHADKKYAPVLLVRMADALARQGNEPGALAVYRTIVESFKDNKAYQIARMKLADRSFLQATSLDYQPLVTTYRDIAERAGDFDLREEASFKAVLLEAVNASAPEALDDVIKYQKRFPKSVYTTVVREIREDLVELAYRQGDWDKDPKELIRLVNDNQEYLAGCVRVSGFLPAVTTAYEKAGRPLDLIALYIGLLERPWVNDANGAYLYLQVADQADMLGDSLMAKKMLRGFTLRYPFDPQIRMAKERLGAINYADGELDDARTQLIWLLNKNEQAKYPVSYYYLGRSLWKGRQYAQTALSMELYLATIKGAEAKSPLYTDAVYVTAQARQALGQRKEATALLESALKLVPQDRADQLLYKLGELAQQDGKIVQARSYFERVVKEGKDADWRRLATQSLEDLPTAPPAPPSKKSKVK